MRKAALSLTNCLAEGHGRFTYKDRRHFCYESRGSLEELVDDINECKDLSYVKLEHLDDLRRDAFRVLQLIDGYIRYLKSQHETQRRPKNAKNQTITKPPLPKPT